MKTFTLFLTLIFAMNVSASTGVKTTLDEFAYAMTVDGSAMDPVKANETMNEYRDRLISSGASRDEIINTALAGFVDQKKAVEIRLALSHIEEQKLSEEQALMILQGVLSNGQQGASWNGFAETMRQFQIFGIVALVAVLLVKVVNSTVDQR